MAQNVLAGKRIMLREVVSTYKHALKLFTGVNSLAF